MAREPRFLRGMLLLLGLASLFLMPPSILASQTRVPCPSCGMYVGLQDRDGTFLCNCGNKIDLPAIVSEKAIHLQPFQEVSPAKAGEQGCLSCHEGIGVIQPQDGLHSVDRWERKRVRRLDEDVSVGAGRHERKGPASSNDASQVRVDLLHRVRRLSRHDDPKVDVERAASTHTPRYTRNPRPRTVLVVADQAPRRTHLQEVLPDPPLSGCDHLHDRIRRRGLHRRATTPSLGRWADGHDPVRGRTTEGQRCRGTKPSSEQVQPMLFTQAGLPVPYGRRRMAPDRDPDESERP